MEKIRQKLQTIGEDIEELKRLLQGPEIASGGENLAAGLIAVASKRPWFLVYESEPEGSDS